MAGGGGDGVRGVPARDDGRQRPIGRQRAGRALDQDAWRRHLAGAVWYGLPAYGRTGATAMLLENDVKEHLALAYVYAVASRAGCSTELTRVDRNSVDVTLTHVDPGAGPDQVREGILGVQVKAHVHDPPPGPIQYYLHNEKNFRDLCDPHLLRPKLLVVVLLPEDEAAWVHLREDALELRRCG